MNATKTFALLASALVCANCAFSEPTEEIQPNREETCQHDWRRVNNGFTYCSYPPKYDFTCSKCGKTKVDVDPLEAWCYQMPKDIEMGPGIDYTAP